MNNELKIKVKENFSKQYKSYNRNASVQNHAAKKLIKTLKKLGLELNEPLEIGCGTGFLTEEVLTEFLLEKYVANDLSEAVVPEMENVFNTKKFTNYRFSIGDAENINFTDTYDAVLSSSCFQWFSQPLEFVEKITNLLPQNGVFAFTSFGKKNYREIKLLTGKSLNYLELRDWIAILSKDFNLIYSHEEEIKLYFDSPKDLLKHMKYTGVNKSSSSCFTPKQTIQFLNEYKQNFSNNKGQVVITYQPIYIIATKK